MPAHVLVIGLDAYEHTLLLRWAQARKLPTLGRLLDSATWGITEAPPAVYAGAVWPSFYTGTSPAQHRRFFRRQAARGEYLDVDFTPRQIVGTPLWQTLSEAGRTVAVLDVPHTVASRALNGIQLVDWASHEPEIEQGATYPESLRTEIIDRFGMEPRDLCEVLPHSVEGYRSLYSHLAARVRKKGDLSCHYLKSRNWDFFITVFGEAHCAGHQWWHLHDPSHPRHDARIASQTGDLMEQTYIAIDRAVGEVIEAAGPQTQVIVLSTHGMGPLYGESVVLDEILRRLDAAGQKQPLFARLKKAWYTLPPAIRGSLPALAVKGRVQRSLHRSLLVPERQTRRFFAIPHNPHAGAVRINVAGRESHGLVLPGEDYRQICNALRHELLQLTCPETGRNVVREVYVTADTYQGPFVHELPDLLVEWDRQAPVTRIASPRIGSIDIPLLGGRTGDHTREGIFLATGRRLKSGPLDHRVSIMDFAPTFCSMLEVPPNEGFEGRPITDLCSLS